MKKSIVFSAITMVFLFLFSVAAQLPTRQRQVMRDPVQRVEVYLYPHPLNSEDLLTDGDTEKLIRLEDDTLLIWVDLEPAARFTHATAYVLISPEGTRVEEGGWWPVLNGREILHGDRNHVAVNSPFQLKWLANHIDIYFHSETISPQDRVTDGPDGRELSVRSKSFLAWIDLHPGMFFTHPTQYLLISADGTVRLAEGSWWPELNGKVILYGNRDNYGVPFPFGLTE